MVEHIRTLQEVPDHSDLKLTVRYAHLAPEYRNEVIDKGEHVLIIGVSK